MLGIVLTSVGVVMLLAGIPGAWISREALRNEGPHRPLFWVGFSLAAASYVLFALSLIMNSASWFGLAASVSVASYFAGATLQRIARRRV